MKFAAKLLTVLSILPIALTGPRAVAQGKQKQTSPDAAATVVVFNQSDPASVSLAASYAEKRGVPYDHLVGLSCPVDETINRATYNASIAEPLRKIFADRGWWQMEPHPARSGDLRVVESSIRYVAIMRGVPLKIAPEPQMIPGDHPEAVASPLNRNEASVDSELALLGQGNRQVSGPLENPYFRSLSRAQKSAFPPGLLLVCRLDAAAQRTVQRMIDDAVMAEKTGLWGFAYIDSRRIMTGGFAMGDEWLRSIVSATLRNGIPAVHEDTPELFPGGYPMRQAALYFGWYTENVAGPFRNPGFRFVPGAVAVHIHSFSASTLRDPLKNWCAPLLDLGAAATIGNVYEPYLHLTSHLDVFEDRLRNGFNFAEAAYASQPALSWMSTFLGDPLYRPFKVQRDGSFPKTGRVAEWAAYREGAQLWFSKKRAAGEAALQAKGNALKSGVIFEGLASLQISVRDSGAAVQSLLQARQLYSDDEDKARCALHAAGMLFNSGKKEQALALVREQLAAAPHGVAVPLLKMLVSRLSPPPPAAPGKPPTNAASR